MEGKVDGVVEVDKGWTWNGKEDSGGDSHGEWVRCWCS